MGVLANHLLVVSGLATTTYLCWLCRSLLPDKEDCFVRLLTVAFSTRYSVCALSLHPSWHAPGGFLASFGWHVIPAGHFPQNSLSKNSRIGFFPLPTARPCPLTHDPPLPMCLGLARASPSSSPAHAFAVIWRLFCTFCRVLLASYGVGCFSICHSL